MPIAAGVDVERMVDDLQALRLVVKTFTSEDAEIAGRLWEQTRQYGLSLGDRACLSLGLRLNVPVLTTCDRPLGAALRYRTWANLTLSLDVRVIR